MTTNTAQHAQPYEYRALRPGPNNIRLLRILPGTGNTGIFCELFAYTLRAEKTSGLYEALSCVWGSSADPQQIALKNVEDPLYCTFQVTKNLFGALRRLRDADLPRTFWIDAICINQNDLQERESQVQIMARIYAYAMEVTVWLGEEDDDSSSVFEKLHWFVLEGWGRGFTYEEIRTELEPVTEPTLALLNRPWFRRAWVVQEVAVAKNLTVACGDTAIAGWIFATGIDALLHYPGDSLASGTSLPPVLLFWKSHAGPSPLRRERFFLREKSAELQLADSMPSFNVLPLGELIHLFRYQKATDQRDKIYSLLGLSADNSASPHVRPDYVKPWSILFRDVIKHVLGSSPIVSTQEFTEQAVIFETGSVLATVYRVINDQVHVKSPVFGFRKGCRYFWKASLFPTNHSNSLKSGDILVLFQNARYPSLIRPCGDHFDIVMISLPSPLAVDINLVELHTSYDPKPKWKPLTVPWSELAHGAGQSIRQFNLIWDWTDCSDPKNHETLLNECSCPTSTSLERSFNTVRVLDDILDLGSIRNLLKHRSVTSDHGTMGKHMILMEHICVHWDDYILMKRYFTTLQWIFWSSRAPINSHYLLDYWHHFGLVGSDLFEISKFAEDNAEKLAGLDNEHRRLSSKIESWQHELYPLVFPTHSLPSVTDDDLSSASVLPHKGRFLTRLVTASQRSPIDLTDTTLARMSNNIFLRDMLDIVIMLVPQQVSALLCDPHVIDIWLYKLSRWNARTYFSVVLDGIAHSSVMSWSFLEYVSGCWKNKHHEDILFIHLLEGNSWFFFQHFEDSTALCEHEIDMWINRNRSFNSVLNYIIETAEYFIHYGDTHYRFRQPYQRIRRHYLSVSIHNTASLFSFEMLVEWAREAVCDSIERFLALRRKVRRQRQREGTSVSSLSSTLSSAESSVTTSSACSDLSSESD